MSRLVRRTWSEIEKNTTLHLGESSHGRDPVGTGSKKKRRWGRAKKKVTSQYTGKTRSMKIRGCVPKKCKAPQRICIRCQSAKIHKNETNYEQKICKPCLAPAVA